MHVCLSSEGYRSGKGECLRGITKRFYSFSPESIHADRIDAPSRLVSTLAVERSSFSVHEVKTSYHSKLFHQGTGRARSLHKIFPRQTTTTQQSRVLPVEHVYGSGILVRKGQVPIVPSKKKKYALLPLHESNKEVNKVCLPMCMDSGTRV